MSSRATRREDENEGAGSLCCNPRGSRMLQIKFQASYRAKLQLDFSLLRFFVSFTDHVFGLAVGAATAELSVSAFDALHENANTVVRCIRSAFHFFRDAIQCISTTIVDTQRFSISFANNFVCEAISVFVNATSLFNNYVLLQRAWFFPWWNILYYYFIHVIITF